MSATGKLAAFAVAVAVAFGLGYGVGDLVGPFGEREDAPAVHDEHETGEQ